MRIAEIKALVAKDPALYVRTMALPHGFVALDGGPTVWCACERYSMPCFWLDYGHFENLHSDRRSDPWLKPDSGLEMTAWGLKASQKVNLLAAPYLEQMTMEVGRMYTQEDPPPPPSLRDVIWLPVRVHSRDIKDSWASRYAQLERLGGTVQTLMAPDSLAQQIMAALVREVFNLKNRLHQLHRYRAEFAQASEEVRTHAQMMLDPLDDLASMIPGAWEILEAACTD